jgi:hypothetical protein
MPKKRFSTEQIVTLLRQIEVSMAQGKSAPEALHFAHYNLESLHKTLRITPAMAVIVTDRVCSLEELVEQASK